MLLGLQLPPQCSQYMTMSSSTRKFSYFNNDEYQCDFKSSTNSHREDWSGPGWYRVMGGAGTQLSTHVFTNGTGGYCKTTIGGWITGGHLQSTTPGQIVNRTIKFDRPGYDYTGHDYTRHNHDISVTNCDGFFVYNLPGIDVSDVCGIRYCTQ